MPKGTVYFYRMYISVLTSLSFPLTPKFSPQNFQAFLFSPSHQQLGFIFATNKGERHCLLRNHLPHTFNSRLTTAQSQVFNLRCHTSILVFLLLIKVKNGKNGYFPSSKMGKTTSFCKRAQAPLFCSGYQSLLVKGCKLETLKMCPANPVICTFSARAN